MIRFGVDITPMWTLISSDFTTVDDLVAAVKSGQWIKGHQFNDETVYSIPPEMVVHAYDDGQS